MPRQHKSTFIQLLCFFLDLREAQFSSDLIKAGNCCLKGNIYFNVLGDCRIKNCSGGLVLYSLDCRSACEQNPPLLITSGVVCTQEPPC